MEKQTVYIVNGYYDMNIGTDEEIIQEVYATEELAKQRVRFLIDAYKKGNEEYNDDTADEWWEEEYKLYAYSDSEWNVDIYYEDVEVATTVENRNVEHKNVIEKLEGCVTEKFSL